jgi:hypothetical protein
MTRPSVVSAVLALGLVATPAHAAAAPGGDTEVTVGSDHRYFSANTQNQPGLAVDPADTDVLVAGADDDIDLEWCAAGDPRTCPSTPGVGVSGVQFSFDSGETWVQPTYTGLTARTDACRPPATSGDNPPCEPEIGPIGTLPWYHENGLVSGGSPELVFGPVPDDDGSFAWDNGHRLYYANTATRLDEDAERGERVVAVSRTDDVDAAASGDEDAWMDPVLVTGPDHAPLAGTEQIWADNAESSPYFGTVYVCDVGDRVAGGNEPVLLARSTDAGDTWTTRQLTPATTSPRTAGPQGCAVRTDSEGVVYVVWSGDDTRRSTGAVYQSRSTDGGRTFERPRVIADTAGIGRLDPVQERFTIDGVAGARTAVLPSLDIANGAPYGNSSTDGDATDEIVLVWSDDSSGTGEETAWIIRSGDGGDTYTEKAAVSVAGDRADQPAVAIAPNGGHVYVSYGAFLQPWQPTTAEPRMMQGVVTYVTPDGSVTEVHRGVAGDARGSSTHRLTAQSPGDHDDAVATREWGYAVWDDMRGAAACDEVDAYRQAYLEDVTGGAASDGLRPAPNSACPQGGANAFGNTGVQGARVVPPTLP